MKSRRNQAITILVTAMAALSAGALAACTSDDTPHEVIVVDSGTPGTKDSGGTTTGDGGDGDVDGGGGTDAAEPECFTNPVNHHQLINACTDAARVDKTVTLPNLLPDGGLPPLP